MMALVLMFMVLMPPLILTLMLLCLSGFPKLRFMNHGQPATMAN
jgi:hypothetical protein